MSAHIRLVTASRYHCKGTLFERGKIYKIDDKKADHLLDQADPQTGMSYFEEVSARTIDTIQTAKKKTKKKAAKKTAKKKARKKMKPAPTVDLTTETLEAQAAIAEVEASTAPEVVPEEEEGGMPL